MRKIKGIKKVCSLTRGLRPYYGLYLQVGLKVKSGQLVSFVHTNNSWTAWNSGVVAVADYYRPTAMAKIRVDVARALARIEKGTVKVVY